MSLWLISGLHTALQKNLSGGHTPGPPWKGRTWEGKKKEGSGEEGVEGGRVASWLLGDGRPCGEVKHSSVVNCWAITADYSSNNSAVYSFRVTGAATVSTMISAHSTEYHGLAPYFAIVRSMFVHCLMSQLLQRLHEQNVRWLNRVHTP